MDFKSSLQKTLGDSYTLERELEGGGMARVFVAHDQQLGRKVVVKTLADDSGVSVSAERFRREIRLAASLQQANIVPVHSAGDVDGVPYYTMPFVEGQSLRAHMDERGPLEIREAMNILRDVARALAFAHERGVVHRDIKPENILLSGSTAVVTDFGIAKAIEASHSMAGATTLTQLGTLLGTPAYISPEQAAGDPHVDHQADIYSLGVVAYEMLAGVRPFTATAARALLAAHVNEVPPPVTSKREGLPPRLASLVMRCLEKEPARRPQKATDLLDALEGALAPSSAASTGGALSIAVLPFANLSPDAADGFFADGLTDEIITDLSALKSLRVISRAAMMRFKGTEKEPAVVARELHVRYVLDGSVRRAGDSLRLTARLIDTETDSTIWSDKLNGKLEDVFEMQERVSRTIVDALRLKLSPQEERRLAERPIADLQAYEAYLQARQQMWSFTVASLDRARQMLDAARARIGENPRLLATLGNLHLNYIETGAADPAAHLADAWKCAERLAAIEPDSFATNALRGGLEWRTGSIREAMQSLRRALELEPNSVDVSVFLAYAYLMSGQDDRARALAVAVPKVDPLTPLFQVMEGFCDVMAGNAAAAIAPYKAFAEADPGSPIAQYFYLAALSEAQDTQGAAKVAAEISRSFPGTIFADVGALYAQRIGGGPSSTPGVTPAMRSFAASSDAFARPLGVLLAQIGEHDAAIDALECSVRLGLAHYPYLARNCKALEPLRNLPRFRALLDVVRGRWERGGTSAEDLRESQAPAQTAGSAKPVIAVLPLTNMSASADDEYFADGMTEDVIAQLSRIASLTVIARASVMRFKGASKRPREVGADLGATHIVDGSVRRAGSRLRIVAQLVDARTEATLWTETFDREMADVFAVQADVAERIASALRTRLTGAERDRMSKAPTKNLAAYEAYLRGRQAYHAPPAEKVGYSTAAAHFERAISLDANFAQAYAALAWIHSIWAQGYWGTSPRDAWPRVQELAQRALALDPECGEARLALAVHAATFRFAFADAVRDAVRALESEPSNSTICANLAYIQSMCGMTEEAIASARRAHELDPLSPSVRFEPFVLVVARRFEEALAGYEELERLVPGTFFVAIWHPICLVALNRHADALQLLRANESLFKDNWSYLTATALLAACGDAAGARTRLARMHALEATEYVWPVGFAMAYAHLGEFDRAFQYLEKACDDRAGWITFLPTGTFFDPLRGDPRLDALIRKVGAPVNPTSYRPPKRETGRQSIAVLPFANLSPDPENEFFADGITDDLIAQVAKIGSLRVIARTSVMRYRGVADAARTAARELGVGAIVEGTVRRAGKRARIVAQLVDASSEAPIWSETYDRDLDDIFSVQSEVATSVANALKATLSPAEEKRFAGTRAVDAATYDLYLLGRHHANRRTDESLRKAMAYFRDAIARDPKFTAAHAGLADAYLFAGLGYATMPAQDAFALAKVAVAGALALDDSNPEALCAQGMIAMQADWDVPRARRSFERAIELNPSSASGHEWLAWSQFAVGDYLDAAKSLERALQLDPLNVSIVTESAWPYTYAGLDQIALKRYRKAVELDPGYALGHYNVGWSLHRMGDAKGAVVAYEQALAAVGRMGVIICQLAIARGQLGETAESERLLDELREQVRGGSAANLALALAADELGKHDEALDALERAHAAREPFIWCLGLEGWLRLPNARKSPRFRKLCEAMSITPHDVAAQRALLLAHAREVGLQEAQD